MLKLDRMWKSCCVKPRKISYFPEKKYDFSNFYSLRNNGFCQKEVSMWKFLIAIEKNFTPRLPFHFRSHLLCLDRHNLVYCIASQMPIPWHFSAITAHCSSSCLYGASTGSCLTEVWRPFPFLINLFNSKSFIPTACVCTGSQLLLSTYYVCKYTLVCFC